jgi:hypothetical protein
MKIYVLTMWDAKTESHELILNGPFTNAYKASSWGRAWGDAIGDNRMWQVVHIANTDVPVRAV